MGFFEEYEQKENSQTKYDYLWLFGFIFISFLITFIRSKNIVYSVGFTLTPGLLLVIVFFVTRRFFQSWQAMFTLIGLSVLYLFR